MRVKPSEIHEINNNSFNNKNKMYLIPEYHISIQGTNTYSNT